jgi:hypothetical protein
MSLPRSQRAQRTHAFDFDGVFHSYKSGWTGPVPEDEPVEGAVEFTHWARERDLLLEIFTRRVHPSHRDREEALAGIYRYLEHYDFAKGLIVTAEKPNALTYWDDRAFRFQGDFEEVKRIISDPSLILPWTKVRNDRP